MPRPPRRQPQLAAPPAANAISAFARVSKSHALPSSSFKAAAAPEPQAASRKRKAASLDKDASHGLAARTVSFPPSDDDEAPAAPAKRACRRAEPQPLPPVKPVPKGKRVARATPSRAESVHKPSESTVLAKWRRRDRTTQTRIEIVLKTRKPAKQREHPPDAALPLQLAELVRLNRAFLKTLAIHIAHAGANAPVDIRALAPNISRSWGKRQVTAEDIRRCVAVQSYSKQSPFIVSDYGRGKLCVELAAGHDGASLSQERLGRQFEENLRALCAERAMDDMADVDVPLSSLSLYDLPQAAVTDKGAGAQADPTLAKGQRALSELKSGLAAKRQDKETRRPEAALNPDGTKTSLLDRLRLKQLAKADEPLPPTGPELARRAALNRVADVAAIISMLSLSNPLSLPRQAFTMAAISDRLRDSLRVPVSRDEGAACVRLIAAEVAPEWLRVVTIGGRENVVVQRSAQPVDRVIHERVQKLLAA